MSGIYVVAVRRIVRVNKRREKMTRVASPCQKSRVRRGPEVISDSDLDEEPEDANLTIKKLEDRLAALKKRGAN